MFHLPDLSRKRIVRYVLLGVTVCCTIFYSSVLSFASDSSFGGLDSSSRESETVYLGDSRLLDQGSEAVKIENLRIAPSDTSGFHAVILSLIGDYNPIAVTTSYQYPSGTGYQTRYQVDVEPDWSWICTASIFVVIIFCLFRLLGGLFAWKR